MMTKAEVAEMAYHSHKFEHGCHHNLHCKKAHELWIAYMKAIDTRFGSNAVGFY